MSITIYKASDIKKNPLINMLIYGGPGVGKTTFAATANKTLIFNFESGLNSISDCDVDVVDLPKLDNFSEALKIATSGDYETIVFDSLTRYSELKMDQILSADHKLKPQIQHWGELVTKIKQLIWALQGKNLNTIFICLEKEVEQDGKLIKRPSLTGQLAQSIPAIVDVCGYLYVSEDGTRRLSINPTSRWYAKHRCPLKNKIDEDIEPDFNGLKSRIFADA